jgi:hypothetical protein
MPDVRQDFGWPGPIDDLIDATTIDPKEALNAASGPIGDVTGGIGNVASALTNVQFWVRVGIGYMGFMFILGGLVIMVMSSRASSAIKSGTMAVATTVGPGKVAKVAANVA